MIDAMASSVVHAVMVLDGERLLASHFGVPTDQVIKVALDLQKTHGAGARVLVDGRDLGEVSSDMTKPRTPAQTREAARAENAGVELAHHMLWESYKRASTVQAHMIDQMSGCAVEMNRRFVEQLEEMRAKYANALEKIDAMAFQQKVVEQDTAFRQLSFHHHRMAEDERLAEERRRINNQTVIEQVGSVIGAVARVITAIGDESIDGTTKN